MIGEFLSNRYEILEKIGDGGMAVVYRAKDTLLNRLVAVKVLREQFAGDNDFVQRFQREAQAAASLSHPNVVNIYDVGYTVHGHYIVMEYVEGYNLSELIKKEGVLDEFLAIKIAIQIASALNHAHQHNIVHRDVKPHNILLTRDFRVKVADFGIAAVSSFNITQTGMVLGSVHYFSPEQARGNKVDHLSDLYSLGIVMYEMLTGKVPFSGSTPISIALSQIQDRPTPIREINPKISSKLENIVLKLLAKRANGRYQSAQEVIDALEELNSYDKTVQPKINIERTQVLPVVDIEPEFDEPKKSKEELKSMSVAEKPPKKARKKSKRSKRLIIVLIVLLVFGGITFATVRFIPKVLFPEDVKVPSIVGLDVNVARRLLAEQGLNLEIEREVFNNDIAANHIISQEPKADRTIKQGRTILVRVSKGTEVIPMPSVEGQTVREAKLFLTQAGFTLGDELPSYDPNYPVNIVIQQDPRPGEQVPKGTRVDLVVSKAQEEPILVRLPDFRRQELEDVKEQLAQLGLNLGNTWPEYSTTIPRNQVIEQNPSPYSEVELGWTVDLVYSLGMPGGTASSPQDDGISRWSTDGVWRENIVRVDIPEGRAQEVVILVVDDFGAREVYREIHPGGSSFSQIVQGRGSQARIQVYIGGSIFKDEPFRD